MTQQATNQNKRAKTKWTRRVSRKFYQTLCRQVHTVSRLSDDITESDVMKCIDDYIDTGTANVHFTDAETIVFTLLQPLIDKAMVRSMRARAAASRRRERSQVTTAKSATPPDSITQEPTSSEAKERPTATASAETNKPSSVSSSEITAPVVPETSETTVTTMEPLPSSPHPSREEKRAKRREAALLRRQAKRLKRLSRRLPASELS